jgi:hypothetical protein
LATAGGALAMAGAPGMQRPGSFTQRAPVTVFLLGAVTCGIYAYFWLHGTAKEMQARGVELPPFWHVFIPILGLIWFWKWCQGLEKATQGQLPATMNLLKLWFLGVIGMAWIQSDLNKLQ